MNFLKKGGQLWIYPTNRRTNKNNLPWWKPKTCKPSPKVISSCSMLQLHLSFTLTPLIHGPSSSSIPKGRKLLWMKEETQGREEELPNTPKILQELIPNTLDDYIHVRMRNYENPHENILNIHFRLSGLINSSNDFIIVKWGLKVDALWLVTR